jgi:hypothetical protein
MNRRIYSVVIKFVVYNQIRYISEMFRRQREYDTFLLKRKFTIILYSMS